MLLAHLQDELDQLKDPTLNERTQAILSAYDEAAALGAQPSAWLDGATRALQADLAATSARHDQLIAELDRWIEFRGNFGGQN